MIFAYDMNNTSKSIDEMIEFFHHVPTKMKVHTSILSLLIIASANRANSDIYTLLGILSALQYDIRSELGDNVNITLVYKNAFMHIYNNTARTWEE